MAVLQSQFRLKAWNSNCEFTLQEHRVITAAIDSLAPKWSLKLLASILFLLPHLCPSPPAYWKESPTLGSLKSPVALLNLNFQMTNVAEFYWIYIVHKVCLSFWENLSMNSLSNLLVSLIFLLIFKSSLNMFHVSPLSYLGLISIFPNLWIFSELSKLHPHFHVFNLIRTSKPISLVRALPMPMNTHHQPKRHLRFFLSPEVLHLCTLHFSPIIYEKLTSVIGIRSVCRLIV